MNALQRFATKLLGIPVITGANLVYENLYRWVGNDFPILKSDNYDYTLNALESVGAVYECVTLITNKALEAPLITYEVTHS